jgi:hypothetical protein
MFASSLTPEQLQPGPVRASSGHEPSSGRAEHELEHLAPLAAHFQAPALLVHRQHDAALEAATEVSDPRVSADAGRLS